MKLIAWDTSSKLGVLCAIEWDERARGNQFKPEEFEKSVRGMTLDVDAQHSEKLLWGIDQLLKQCGWTKDEVDLFGVGVGPGSFTGLRIGITTARTLAHALGKPLIPFSSLVALSRNAAAELKAAGNRVVVVAATDASKGELFYLAGAAKSLDDCIIPPEEDFAGVWKRGVDEKTLAPDEIVRALKRRLSEGKGNSQWIVLGEGALRYPELWEKIAKSKRILPQAESAHRIQPVAIAWLCWQAYQRGLVRPPLAVTPQYLRESDAERKLKQGLLGRN